MRTGRPIITFSAAAERDIESIGDYIAEHNPTAAIKFVTLIHEQCVKSARQPGIGKPAQVQGSDARCFPFKSYLIFYLPLDNRATILRIIHGARDIEQAVKD